MSFGWMRDRWCGRVVWVTEMGTVLCGLGGVCIWNRVGLVPCVRLEKSDAGAMWSWGWNKS